MQPKDLPGFKSQLQILNRQMERHEKGEITDKNLNATSKAVEQGAAIIGHYVRHEAVKLAREKFKHSQLLAEKEQKKEYALPKPGYWDDIYNIKQHLNQIKKKSGGYDNKMLTGRQIKELGEPGADLLIKAICDLGGFETVAKELGLQFIKTGAQEAPKPDVPPGEVSPPVNKNIGHWDEEATA
jgi:hypothetical protein